MIHRRTGFTLIEVVVAVSLGALVVLLAHRVFTGVVDGSGRLADAREALDRQANARRLLDHLAGSLEIGTDGAEGFEGRPNAVAFTSWQLDARGWWQRRRVRLGVEDGALTVTGLAEEPFRLADSVTALELDYLLEPGAHERWVREWISPVSAPVAMRIRVSRGNGKGDGGRVDTLLLVVGTRG